MTRKPKPAPPPLPSREDILAFIARESEAMKQAGAPGKIGKREIGRAFGITGSDKIALKRLLKEMEAEGETTRKRRGYARPGGLPPTLVAAIVGRDGDGELLARPTEWDEAAGPAPRLRIVARRGGRDQPAPGIGQTALLRVEPAPDEDGAFRARVVKILARGGARTLGLYRRGRDGAPDRIEPVDKKNAGREWFVPDGASGGAEDGDLVAIELRREGRFGRMAAVVVERLGSLASERAASQIAILTHGLPDRFRPEALAEAERARPAHAAGREDWRDLALVTIDPPDAKDHDDAVHAAPDEAPDNPGGFVVTVAIADVAYYVRPGSAMDRDALERGNSVYFPDRVVPMLPERISNDLCSLREGEDRPALAVRLTLAADGRKLRHSFHRVLMRSAAKLSYEEAQAAIDGRPNERTAPLLAPILQPLWAAYAAAAAARDRRQPLDLDLPERKLILDAAGRVDRVVTPRRLEAHRLIEEFMILANVAAAETLEQKRQALIYRVHDEPSAEKLAALGEFLATIGVKLAKGQALRPGQFNQILDRARGGAHAQLTSEVVLRTQAQAEYAAENVGHFGLALRRYAHFTSPIRRYADLVVHRALIRALRLGEGGLPDLSIEALAETAARISAAERRAMAAERDTADRLIAAFLADRIGARFEGRIAGVTRAGLFVKLTETGADGFAPAATLGRGYFRFEEAARALIGPDGGYRLGDNVEVRLVEAAPVAGALRFEVLTPPSRSARGAALPRKAAPARDKPSRKTKKAPYRRGKK